MSVVVAAVLAPAQGRAALVAVAVAATHEEQRHGLGSLNKSGKASVFADGLVGPKVRALTSVEPRRPAKSAV